MESFNKSFDLLEKELIERKKTIDKTQAQIEEKFELMRKCEKIFESNQKEIEELAQKRYENILDKANINCEDDNGEKIIPTIDILQENYQALKSSVDEILNEFNQKTVDLREKTQPYGEKLREFLEITNSVEELKNENWSKENSFRNAYMRITKNDQDMLSIGFHRNGEYLYGIRVKNGNRAELWKQIKEKMNIH